LKSAEIPVWADEKEQALHFSKKENHSLSPGNGSQN